MDQFFVITSTEDGISITGPYTAAEVQKKITPDEHGETWYGSNPTFADKMPHTEDGHFNDSRFPDAGRIVVILRGSIIVPTPVARVTEYKLDA